MAYSRRSSGRGRSGNRGSGRVSAQRRSAPRGRPAGRGARRSATNRQPREFRIVIEQRGMTSTRPEAMQIEKAPQKAKF